MLSHYFKTFSSRHWNLNVTHYRQFTLVYLFGITRLRLENRLELENNTVKKRVGCYIRENLKYRRRNDLESLNSHVIIIDFENAQKNYKRIINLYRSFNPIGVTPKDLFIKQLKIIKNAFDFYTVVIGNFNLDYNRRFDVTYGNSNLFGEFDLHLEMLNPIQIVNFDTWYRIVNNCLKSSCLDHAT